MQKLITALIKAKKDFKPIEKNKVLKSSNFSHKYADLDSVLASVEPALLAHGLVLTQVLANQTLVTRLYHESGEMLESVSDIPHADQIAKWGGNLTYVKRYALQALLCVVADEDVDAADHGDHIEDHKRKAAAAPIQTYKSESRSEEPSRADPRNGEFVFPWGKHAGVPLSKVPENYIKWLFDSSSLDKPENTELKKQILKAFPKFIVEEPSDLPF